MSIAISSSANYHHDWHQVNSHSRFGADLKKKVADNPAGAAIAEKLLAQMKGYDQGARNGVDGQGLINTSDGALSNISDSLQRMRELSVQASSTAIYSDSDRQMMQEEIEQLKQHISDVSKNTQFNTKNLLDGSMADMHLALNPEGGGMEIHTADATLDALGIADYDVTGDFDISKLDDAISMVNGARSSLGAQSSALDFSIGAGRITSENLTSSYSNLTDEDVENYVTERDKRNVLQQYQYFLITQQRDQQENMISRMLGA